MIYFRLALLLNSLIISSLCNAMNESDHHLSLVRSFSTEEGILGVGFPTNDTVLTRHEHGWSTFCPKTGEQKINSKNKLYIIDFDLSKDGKIAIVDRNNLTVHDIETGKIIYKKAILGDLKRVAFCSNNNTLGVYNRIRDSITIHTIGTNEEEEKYTTPPYVGQSLFAGNPTNKEFIIGNKIVKYVTVDKNITTTNLPVNIIDMLSNSYNPDGTVIAIRRENGYLFHKTDNQVYEKDNQDFVINNSKNSGKSNGDESYYYYSIAFHPKKRFAALFTRDNSIEFWDYTKKTEKPLAIIELPSKNKQTIYFSNDRLTAFAPNGKILAVIIAGGNTFYTMPTPETAYYDDATKAQCVTFNWAIKNWVIKYPYLRLIPQDIINEITYKLSRIPDFQLPKPTTK
jgi:WD40 repeat protein